MVGWIYDIQILKSILPNWVTMKFSTALCFVMSGISLFFIAGSLEKNSAAADIVLPVTSLIISLFMANLLFSVFTGVSIGIEDMFVKETGKAIKTTVPGRPSVGTMVAFLLISASGILTLLKSSLINGFLAGIGWMVSALGAVAISGYLIKMPVLYFTVTGWSTAMALHTAILFFLLGIGLILTVKGKA